MTGTIKVKVTMEQRSFVILLQIRILFESIQKLYLLVCAVFAFVVDCFILCSYCVFFSKLWVWLCMYSAVVVLGKHGQQ